MPWLEKNWMNRGLNMNFLLPKPAFSLQSVMEKDRVLR